MIKNNYNVFLNWMDKLMIQSCEVAKVRRYIFLLTLATSQDLYIYIVFEWLVNWTILTACQPV